MLYQPSTNLERKTKHRRLSSNTEAMTRTAWDCWELEPARHHFFNGRAAEGFRLAEQSYQNRPTDAVAKFWFTLGLLETLQLERIAEEGDDFLRVGALHLLGRRDEAFELAVQQSRDGELENLFAQYNRAGRSEELVDYLEERWPGLGAFAADYPHNEWGYDLMADIALAYSRTGNTERFDDALMLVENAMSKLIGQGVDNWIFMVGTAKYLALAGKYDEAISELENAVDRGMLGYAPLATNIPMFEPLRDDPRFIALEAVMVENINAEREALGLEPVDPLSRL